jgi:hypothetical protein
MISRSRRGTGLVLILLGAWQALVPMVGPLFGFGMGHESAWTWNQTHLVLNVLPGGAVLIGGLVMLVSVDRATQWLGVVLAFCGGLWGVLGPSTYHVSSFMQIMKSYGYYYATGAVIVVVGVFTVGRLTSGTVTQPAVVDQSEPTQIERQRSA